jgi:hypothetical protein
MFGPKKEEVTGDWRRVHKMELHNLYYSPIIIVIIIFIRVMKRRRIKWAGNVARMGGEGNLKKF